MPVKVAACQVPDVRMDTATSLKWIVEFTNRAGEQNVSIICFPECFLQGYLTEEKLAKEYAINLNSEKFEIIAQQLNKKGPTVIVGLIEEDDGNLFNTAVVIGKGKLIGKYRKQHLLKGEQVFKAGSGSSVFQIKDLKFGINICYDTQFPETVEDISKQGVSAIFCPSNNMMRYETAEIYKDKHHEMRIARVNESKVWLISSDVTGERDGRISYGPTSAINPDGKIISQVPLMQVGMIVVEI